MIWRLIRLVRKVVALLMLIVGLLSAGKTPVPVPAPAAPPPSQAGPSVPTPSAPVAPAPAGVVPTGATPHCTYSMTVNRVTNAKRWIVVCIVYGQTTRLPADWATAGEAREALFAFQQAWRDAVKNGTPL